MIKGFTSGVGGVVNGGVGGGNSSAASSDVGVALGNEQPTIRKGEEYIFRTVDGTTFLFQYFVVLTIGDVLS